MIMVSTKAELAAKYNMSADALRELLNVRYYEKLKDLGYTKTCKILPPKVVREFVEIYGKPINDEEI